MSGRSSEEKFGDRGSTAWDDGLYPIDGGSPGGVPIDAAEAPKATDRPRSSSTKGRDRDVEKTPWFTPVEEEISDCPGGVCPVPWAIETPLEPIVDMVNHPPHYTAGGGIECIEAIEAQQTLEEFRGYLKGCITKYLWRERYKGGIESLEKAKWYLERLIELDKAQNG